MEPEQNTSIFGLGIDQTSRSHLSEAARWAKFLAVCGFIMIALMIVYGIAMTFIIASMTRKFEEMPNSTYSSFGSTLEIWMGVFYLLCAVIVFFPYLFLLKFANKMKVALTSNEQAFLNESFMNLKILYRYVGIITIVGTALMLFAILSVIVSSTILMAT
jgi:preprotein translocase subunit SecG